MPMISPKAWWKGNTDKLLPSNYTHSYYFFDPNSLYAIFPTAVFGKLSLYS